MTENRDKEPVQPEPMTAEAKRHRTIIFVLMLLFCALPIVLLVLKLTSSESP